MSWSNVEVKISGKNYSASKRNSSPEFCLPSDTKIKLGQAIVCNDTSYEVTRVTDVANRGEILEVETKEKDIDESQTRRDQDNTGEQDL